jgi:predicted CXXCH cytochrome family protein
MTPSSSGPLVCLFLIVAVWPIPCAAASVHTGVRGPPGEACSTCHFSADAPVGAFRRDIDGAGPSARCLGCHDETISHGPADGRQRTEGVDGPSARHTGGAHPVGVDYGPRPDLRRPEEVIALGVGLYPGTSGRWTVECGSCHDAHANGRRGLLRGPEGDLCGTCHLM